VKVVLCPLCGDVCERQPWNFWKCPSCGCEVWPPEEETEEDKLKAIRQVYYEEMRTGYWILPKKRGRGSRSSKRFGRKRVPAPLFSQRYVLY
jgi:hypothetical protein